MAWYGIVGIAGECLALLMIILPPVRDRVFGLKKIKDGMKAQLRSEMLRIYYHNRESRTIRQYEYENFILAYEAYKAMGGNSFIDKIYDEVKEWEVIT